MTRCTCLTAATAIVLGLLPGGPCPTAAQTTQPRQGRAASRPSIEIHAFPAAAQGTTQPAGGVATGGQAGASTQPASTDRLTEAICKATLEWFDRAAAMVEKMVPAAEAAAERFIAGGTLYVAGNMGFCDELDYRAGGFPFTVIYDNGKRLNENDVVMIGQFRPNEPEFRLQRFLPHANGRDLRNGMVVWFTSRRWPQAQRILDALDRRQWRGWMDVFDTGTPAGDSPLELSLGQTASAALAWAFCGEVIAAATRQGKTLATWASDWEPDGRQWDESVRGKHVHPKYSVGPIPPGQIGRRYLRICRDQLAEFLASQPGQVRLAARRLARCIQDGGLVWIVTDSHLHPRGSVIPPGLGEGVMNFGRNYSIWQYAQRMPKTDAMLRLGYLRYPRAEANLALSRGVQVVTYCVEGGTTDERLTHIRSCWKAYDTAIDLSGYPIRVLPTSGVVGTTHWYCILAETAEALADLREAPRPRAAGSRPWRPRQEAQASRP